MSTREEIYILAIDLGTSGAKVGLVNDYGEILGWEFEPTELITLPGGGCEQRPDDWWNAILQASHRLLDQNLVPREKITAIGCTSQWNGTVAVDRQGIPLMNALIWLDSRGAKYVPSLTRGLISIAGYDVFDLFLTWIRLAGGAPAQSGKDPLGHILFIKHQHPEVYHQTDLFLEPKDYLNLRLTGIASASYDSIAMHYATDVRRIDHVHYAPRLLRKIGLERSKLPDLRRAVDLLGSLRPRVADELRLNSSVQVAMGTPDMHATAIGSGAVQDYQPHLYVGTSSWVSCHVPFKKTDPLHTITSLPSARPDRYLVLDEQEFAGGCLNYLLDNIFFSLDTLGEVERPHDIYQRLYRLAESVPPGSSKVIFTPWLYGERTPVDDPHVRAGFFNLSPNKTRAHLARSVLEGVAYNTRWLLEPVERFVKRRLDDMHFVGGGAESDLWCQIFADILGRTIHQVKEPRQASLRGAAFVALVALRRLTFEEIPQKIQIQKTFKPNPANQATYASLYREFKALYRATRPIYARLNPVS